MGKKEIATNAEVLKISDIQKHPVKKAKSYKVLNDIPEEVLDIYRFGDKRMQDVLLFFAIHLGHLYEAAQQRGVLLQEMDALAHLRLPPKPPRQLPR